MNNIEKEIKAIYNLQRFQILQTKLNPQTSHLISDAYAYAWYNNLYPFLDTSDLHEDLKKCFEITEKQLDTISLYADSEWREEKYYTFYEYESYFGVRNDSEIGITRHGLIATFRYFYLHGTFDDIFWKTLIKPMEHPSEASMVTSDFNSSYIYLV